MKKNIFLAIIICSRIIANAQENPLISPQMSFGSIFDLTIDEEGEYALSGGGSSIRLWHLPTGKLVRNINLNGVVMCLAIHPRKKQALVGGYFLDRSSIKLVNLETGKVENTFKHQTVASDYYSYSDNQYTPESAGEFFGIYGTINVTYPQSIQAYIVALKNPIFFLKFTN